MIKIHDRDLRGKTKTGWLDSAHTFSFGHFHDPARMGFRSLRVINDDRVIPGAGFGTHPHNNMEIISYVLDGSLEHKDSMGTGSVIKPGEVQRMSAGTGVTHSEFNGSKDDPVHFLQIWIEPKTKGLEPSYEQKPLNVNKGEFVLIGDRHGSDGAITIHQDVKMYLVHLEEGQSASYSFEPQRGGFLHLVRGQVTLNGESLKEGDGAEITDVETVTIAAQEPSEVLLFDLA